MIIAEKIKESCGALSVVQRGNMLALRNGNVGYSCIYTDDSIYQPILIHIQKLIEAYTTLYTIKKALVLGGGCCTIPRFLIKRYHNTICIDSVEYQSEIIALTRKYFLEGMDIDKLNLINDDAYTYIHNTPKLYDFILVDIFVGDMMPQQTHTDMFIKDLECHASCTSLVVFNAYKCTLNQCKELCKQGESLFNISFITADSDGTYYIVFIKGNIDKSIIEPFINV